MILNSVDLANEADVRNFLNNPADQATFRFGFNVVPAAAFTTFNCVQVVRKVLKWSFLSPEYQEHYTSTVPLVADTPSDNSHKDETLLNNIDMLFKYYQLGVFPEPLVASGDPESEPLSPLLQNDPSPSSCSEQVAPKAGGSPPSCNAEFASVNNKESDAGKLHSVAIDSPLLSAENPLVEPIESAYNDHEPDLQSLEFVYDSAAIDLPYQSTEASEPHEDAEYQSTYNVHEHDSQADYYDSPDCESSYLPDQTADQTFPEEHIQSAYNAHELDEQDDIGLSDGASQWAAYNDDEQHSQLYCDSDVIDSTSFPAEISQARQYAENGDSEISASSYLPPYEDGENIQSACNAENGGSEIAEDQPHAEHIQSASNPKYEESEISDSGPAESASPLLVKEYQPDYARIPQSEEKICYTTPEILAIRPNVSEDDYQDTFGLLDWAADPIQPETTGSNKPTGNLYKSKLCRGLAETGTCKYGNKCHFAHSDMELAIHGSPRLQKPNPTQYRTETTAVKSYHSTTTTTTSYPNHQFSNHKGVTPFVPESANENSTCHTVTTTAFSGFNPNAPSYIPEKSLNIPNLIAPPKDISHRASSNETNNPSAPAYIPEKSLNIPVLIASPKFNPNAPAYIPESQTNTPYNPQSSASGGLTEINLIDFSDTPAPPSIRDPTAPFKTTNTFAGSKFNLNAPEYIPKTVVPANQAEMDLIDIFGESVLKTPACGSEYQKTFSASIHTKSPSSEVKSFYTASFKKTNTPTFTPEMVKAAPFVPQSSVSTVEKLVDFIGSKAPNPSSSYRHAASTPNQVKPYYTKGQPAPTPASHQVTRSDEPFIFPTKVDTFSPKPSASSVNNNKNNLSERHATPPDSGSHNTSKQSVQIEAPVAVSSISKLETPSVQPSVQPPKPKTKTIFSMADPRFNDLVKSTDGKENVTIVDGSNVLPRNRGKNEKKNPVTAKVNPNRQLGQEVHDATANLSLQKTGSPKKNTISNIEVHKVTPNWPTQPIVTDLNPPLNSQTSTPPKRTKNIFSRADPRFQDLVKEADGSKDITIVDGANVMPRKSNKKEKFSVPKRLPPKSVSPVPPKRDDAKNKEGKPRGNVLNWPGGLNVTYTKKCSNSELPPTPIESKQQNPRAASTVEPPIPLEAKQQSPRSASVEPPKPKTKTVFSKADPRFEDLVREADGKDVTIVDGSNVMPRNRKPERPDSYQIPLPPDNPPSRVKIIRPKKKIDPQKLPFIRHFQRLQQQQKESISYLIYDIHVQEEEIACKDFFDFLQPS